MSAFILLSLFTLTVSMPLSAENAKSLIEWKFDAAGDVQEWKANDQIKGCAVKDGCLVGRTTGRDPQLTAPLFELEASPFQYVEVRMRVSRSGSGELFWTNTTEEPYAGFRTTMYENIEYLSGGFRTYRIFPFWQDAKKIIRIRLDPPSDGEFAVDSVRILDLGGPESEAVFFDFTVTEEVWASADDPQPTASPSGITVEGPGERFYFSPRLSVQAESLSWLSAMIRTDGAENAIIQWVSDELPGARSHTIQLRRDDRWHVYNIPLDEVPDWLGKVQMLGIRISPPKGKRADILFAGASAEPRGPAELQIRRFRLKEAVNRVGKPAALEAEIANVGGRPAREVQVSLKLCRETSIVLSPSPVILELAPGESRVWEWAVVSRKAGTCPARLNVMVSAGMSAEAEANLRWDPPVRVGPAEYVPEPQIARGDFEVGMYYFPGWYTHTRWSVLDDFPERRPILGYYREGDPAVADWHIKWLVEHGVTFMVYDWYWSAGGRQLEHALHDGYFNAKYRDRIKFCLLWANHNAPKTSSPEDMVNVTRFWLDNYFLRPEYFKIDGKPVVIIFSPHRLTEDLGSEGVRKAFDKSRMMAKARGLPGIYFIACTYPAGRAYMETLEQEGYDALTGYNYPSAGDKGQVRAPYDDMVSGYKQFWNAIADSTKLRYIPVTEPGWDSRPWHGPNARVRTGKTPAKFRKMLENARDFVQKRTPDAEPKVVLIEAWNEFGECDYVEPHQEFGFGHVDAIRDVFTTAPKAHDDVVPQDVGLGPYELPMPTPVSAWEFDDPSSPGWDAPQHLADARIEEGCLVARSTGWDPAFYSTGVDLDASLYGAVEIRMSVDKGTGGQLFWAGRGRGFTEAASIKFELTPDGQFHVYRLDLASSPAWKSRIAALRLDPTIAADARIAVDCIRFIRR